MKKNELINFIYVKFNIPDGRGGKKRRWERSSAIATTRRTSPSSTSPFSDRRRPVSTVSWSTVPSNSSHSIREAVHKVDFDWFSFTVCFLVNDNCLYLKIAFNSFIYDSYILLMISTIGSDSRCETGDLKKHPAKLSKGTPYSCKPVPTLPHPRGAKPTRCAVSLLAASMKISVSLINLLMISVCY